MKFEFVQDTDLILGTTMYYTKQEGIIISGSFNNATKSPLCLYSS